MHSTAEAAVCLYFPETHAATELPPPVYPAFARQSFNAEQPVPEPVPEWEGQSVHVAADAAVSLYVPEVHAATELPLPVYPASARQSLSALEAAGLDEPFKHEPQMRPVCGKYSFALHAVTHAEPETAVPAPQHCPMVAQSPVTQVVDPCSELVPPSQSWHTAGVLYPTMPLVAVPAEQRAQAFVAVSQ